MLYPYVRARPAGDSYLILDRSLSHLASHLARDLGPRLRLNSPVTRIDWDPRGATETTSSSSSSNPDPSASGCERPPTHGTVARGRDGAGCSTESAGGSEARQGATIHCTGGHHYQCACFEAEQAGCLQTIQPRHI